MDFIDKLLATNDARTLSLRLRGAREWGVLFAVVIWGAIVFGPSGFVPVEHPDQIKYTIPVLVCIALALAYMFRRTKLPSWGRALAAFWIVFLFYVYVELGGINSPYALTIIFPLIVESATFDMRWLIQVSLISLGFFFADAGWEYWMEGNAILFPLLYNSYTFLMFVIYLNIAVRNVFQSSSVARLGEDRFSAMVSTLLWQERGGYIERFVLPLENRFRDLMKTIVEARNAESSYLQGALLGVLYEQIYDAQSALRGEAAELQRNIEFPIKIGIRGVVKNALKNLETLRGGEGVNVNIDEGEEILVRMPANALQGALEDLIENAIIYSPEGEVMINFESEAALCRMKITDNGIGIPDEFMGQRFIRGARADNAKKLRPGRRGDGLANCQLLLTTYGAHINVEPRDNERGTVVTLVIPRAA